MGDESHEHKQEEPQETHSKKSIDWKKFLFEKKWILLILIPLVITIMVRLEPMKLKPLESSAEENVINHYRSQIRAELDKQLSDIPEEERNKIAEQKFQEFLKNNRKSLDEQIKQGSDTLKAYLQYESGSKKYVYLGDIDSYYWLRMARNILEKGMQCDVIKDGVCYDSYTVAPNLKSKIYDYYPVLIVGVYKTLKLFNSDLSLMQASFLTPLIFSLVFTIPLFLLLRRIRGNMVAVVGTVLVNVNPYILSRSLGSDNDIVSVFFQAVFLWLAIECFYAKRARTKYIFASLVGVCLSFYSFFWLGWWYLADLFVLTLLLKGMYIMLHHQYATGNFNIRELKKPFKEIGLVVLSFLLTIIVLYGFLFNPPFFLFKVVATQFKVLSFKVAANPNYWPNVLTTVAEFNSMSLPSIISSFGSLFRLPPSIVNIIGIFLPSRIEQWLLNGMPVFLMAILGMIFFIFPTTKFIKKHMRLFLLLMGANILIYFFLKSSSKGILAFLLMVPIFVGMYIHLKIKEESGFYPDVVFLLSIIICLVVYFTTTGVRFLFLMGVPVSIFAAIFFERISRILLSTLRSIFHLPRITVSIAMVILVVWFLAAPVKGGFNTAQGYIPNVNDAWVETLEKIKYESNPDAIINSWWDFGHWFKYLADRRVTLDGSSQNRPQLHWLGKLLLTSDENMSRGILSMLDCGGNKAFDELNRKLNDTPLAYDLLNEIILEKKDKAEKILLHNYFTPEETEAVLNYSHCMPPENFLITSQDMIGKGGVWSHFGSWDFKRSYLSAIVSIMPEEDIVRKFKEDYNISEETTLALINEVRSLPNQDSINAWIAPWPSYYTGLGDCGKSDNLSVCVFSHGENRFPFIIDFEKKEAYVEGPDGKKVYPKTAAFVEGDSFELFKNSGDTIGFGVASLKSGDSVRAAFMAPELTGSMFTRLFFFDGVGLSSFEKFYDTRTVFGDRIITWKVKWDVEGTD